MAEITLALTSKYPKNKNGLRRNIFVHPTETCHTVTTVICVSPLIWICFSPGFSHFYIVCIFFSLLSVTYHSLKSFSHEFYLVPHHRKTLSLTAPHHMTRFLKPAVCTREIQKHQNITKTRSIIGQTVGKVKPGFITSPLHKEEIIISSCVL